MPTLLKLKQRPAAPAAPIDGSSLCPDRLAGLARRDIERLPVLVGRSRLVLADLFEVSGDGTEEMQVEGDLSSFARVGASMTRGSLVVRGGVGPRAATGMRGGTFVVEGRAGDYAGEGMIGGLLRIRGDAGDHLAAPPPGHPRGMNRGTILVDGSAGRMAGTRMRRGLIAVAGDLGEGSACGMLAGSLFVFGRIDRGAGALLRRGTILALGGTEPLPTFLPAGPFRFPFLEIFFDGLESAGFPVPKRARRASYFRHVGDVSSGGVGEILARGETP
jgi:formylmethanofuran dehydrogenase subunit C